MSNKKAFFWGALTGAITGAVSALLLAPKSGRELRKDISDTAVKVGGKTADLSRQAGSAVQTFAKRATSLVSRRKLNGEAALEAEVEPVYETEDSVKQ
ncbi:YtxH domain-containing protein [Cohnella yongneupensis]|uniref:YtxH domain-containing protein n=1 Tax=Cohnella yongneupensis TaxID=425006 RepID=A0ABW0R238_9BACL